MLEVDATELLEADEPVELTVTVELAVPCGVEPPAVVDD